MWIGLGGVRNPLRTKAAWQQQWSLDWGKFFKFCSCHTPHCLLLHIRSQQELQRPMVYGCSQSSPLRVTRWCRCKLTSHPRIFIDPTSSPQKLQGRKFITQRDCHPWALLLLKSLEVNAKTELLPNEGEQIRLVWRILWCLELYSLFFSSLHLHYCLTLSTSFIYHRVFKLWLLTH